MQEKLTTTALSTRVLPRQRLECIAYTDVRNYNIIIENKGKIEGSVSGMHPFLLAVQKAKQYTG